MYTQVRVVGSARRQVRLRRSNCCVSQEEVRDEDGDRKSKESDEKEGPKERMHIPCVNGIALTSMF